jgi:hypothetical protein
MAHHPSVSHTLADPALTWPVCLVLAAIAVLHLVRLGRTLATQGHLDMRTTVRTAATEPVSRSPGIFAGAYLPTECGHVLLAAGMVVMLLADPRLTMSASFTAGYAGLGIVLLGVMIADQHCGDPRLWGCCTILVLESFAMATMAAGWMTGGLLGTMTVFFAAMAVIAATRLVAGVAGFPRRKGIRSAEAAPAVTQLAMAAGMLVMLR